MQATLLAARAAAPPLPLPTSMRALVQRAYGPPEVLRPEEVARPEPGPGQVLVRVHAACVGQGDWHLLRGEPYLIRAVGFGLRRPKRAIPGQYAAGTVAAVGPQVLDLAVGDEVFGTMPGCFAEYVCVDAGAIAPKPAEMTSAEAAALPHGGFAALQAVRDAGGVQSGQRVLVIGAAGAVGALAVQIAVALGARVTAVCRSRQVDFVRGLGAERVLDDAREDFASQGEGYDLIIDTVRNRPDSHYRRAMVRGGRTVMVSGGAGRWLGGMGRVGVAVLTSLFRRKKLQPFLAVPRREDLIALAELVADGRVAVHISRPFPLAQGAEAFRYLESPQRPGVVVVEA